MVATGLKPGSSGSSLPFGSRYRDQTVFLTKIAYLKENSVLEETNFCKQTVFVSIMMKRKRRRSGGRRAGIGRGEGGTGESSK